MVVRKAIDRLLLIYVVLLMIFIFYSYNYFAPTLVDNGPVIISLRYLKESPTNGNLLGSLALSSKNKNPYEEPPFVIIPEVSIGYDFLVRDANRLGLAVTPNFRKLPNSWLDLAKSNKCLGVEALKKGNVKKILMYEHIEWWSSQKEIQCKELEFKCEFHHFDRQSHVNSTEEKSITDAGENFDVIVIPRDFAHAEPIGMRTTATENLTRIYYTLESPMASHITLKLEPRDYLISYWRGSDIYNPYFRWKYFDPKITQKYQERNYAAGRTKMAAIVVSNCGGANRRLDFVHKLRRFIQIDIFGACGDNSYCPNRDLDCFDMLKQDYKFYLAFENSNCRDYVTEKFYSNALRHDMLPIVMGAHPSDYESAAPENSFIHVEDFKTVLDLAKYMKLLDSNDTLYNQYFAWKGTGEFVPTNMNCELCSFVHLHEACSNDVGEFPLSYLNEKDSYDENLFLWSGPNRDLCLGMDETYWNH